MYAVHVTGVHFAVKKVTVILYFLLVCGCLGGTFISSNVCPWLAAPPIQLEGLVQAYFQPRSLAEHLLLSLTASLDDPKEALAGKSILLRQRFYHKVNCESPA